MADLDQLDRIESFLKGIQTQLSRVELKVNNIDETVYDAIYEQDPIERPNNVQQVDDRNDYHEKLSENLIADIMKYGEAIRYRKYEGRAVEDLRKFIIYILRNPNEFNPLEYRYAEYSDKPQFDDLRLSTSSYRILNGAYRKRYNKDIPFPSTPGVLYKYGNQLHWVWSDNK
jgi:hypothetical protein